MGTILIIVLVLMLVGVLPTWPHQRKLGVLSLWWTGFNSPDPTHTAFDWTALKTGARRDRSLQLMASNLMEHL